MARRAAPISAITPRSATAAQQFMGRALAVGDQSAIADVDDVAADDSARCLQAPAFDERSVGAAEVLYDQDAVFITPDLGAHARDPGNVELHRAAGLAPDPGGKFRQFEAFG